MVFMYFVSGRPRGRFDQAQIEQMQTAHIENMKRRYDEGVLKLAGPCADPDQKRRGIVLLDMPGVKGIEKHFVEDPYVEHGLLAIEAMPVTAHLLDLGKPEPSGIEEHTIVLFEASEQDRNFRASAEHYARMAKADRPAVALVMSKPGKLRMVLIFRDKDHESVRKLVEADVAVVKGSLRPLIWKQWLGKGALAPVP